MIIQLLIIAVPNVLALKILSLVSAYLKSASSNGRLVLSKFWKGDYKTRIDILDELGEIFAPKYAFWKIKCLQGNCTGNTANWNWWGENPWKVSHRVGCWQGGIWEIPRCKLRRRMASPLLLIRGYGDFPFQPLLVPHKTAFPVSHLSGYQGSHNNRDRWLPESAKVKQVSCWPQPTKATLCVSATVSRKVRYRGYMTKQHFYSQFLWDKNKSHLCSFATN